MQHKIYSTASPEQPLLPSSLRWRGRGKTRGKYEERKKVNGKEEGMGAAHIFQAEDFNP